MDSTLFFSVKARVVIFVFLLLATIVSLRWIDLSRMSMSFLWPARWSPEKDNWGSLTCPPQVPAVSPAYAAAAPSAAAPSAAAPSAAAPSAAAPSTAAAPLCPDYFKWIHEDLRPWKETGITREMVEKGRPTANFRLVIVGGRAHVETFSRSFQTRDIFTQWGILQLLRRYPGQVPDLELLFDCNDPPVIPKSTAAAPPALFHYCSSESTADITFPDWSFWGWPEVNIKPWEQLAEEMKAANRRLRWADREPYAFWKGNQWVDPARQDLLRCNVSGSQDWKARLYSQDWVAESARGFKSSDLSRQCTHQYKIYIDGRSWSVSRKYILGCDSPVLAVIPRYFDFFSRGLEPLRHFWPVRPQEKCPAIKFAVDWGTRHQSDAQEMGKMGSEFVFEQVKMDYVYDYMLHLLTEYARLLKFKPVVPPGAVELSREALACPAETLARRFMQETEIRVPAAGLPCSLPQPMKPEEMTMLLAERANATHRVEVWEKQATVT